MSTCGCNCKPAETKNCDKGKQPDCCTPEQIKTCHGETKPS